MMTQTLDMRFIRYLNLFSKVSGVSCKNCFFYNNNLIFAVPEELVSKAIGHEGRNVKRLASIIQRRIKIIALPRDLRDAERFVLDIINPLNFKNLEITQTEIIIMPGRQNKAALIGREKVRLSELKDIIKQYFNKELKII